MFYQQAKNSNFDYRLVKDYSGIVNSKVVSNPFFAQADFLNKSKDINSQLKHFVVEAGSEGKVLANFYFQIMPFKGRELKSYIPEGEDCFINKTVEAIVDMALERVNWNLAVLGNVFVTGDNGQHWQVNHLAPEVKWEIAAEASAFLAKQFEIDAFLFSDLREKDLNGHQQLLEKGYRCFEVEPDLVFDIDQSWTSFEDYLDNVVSKYRVRTKKVLEKSMKLDVKDLDITDIKAEEKEIYQLYKNVVDGAAFKLAEIKPSYFQEFKQAHAQQFFVRGYYLNEKLVGVISYFEDVEVSYMNFVGLDYSNNREHCIYQRILYDAIEQGILTGKKHIHFGRTASEIKTSVGAKPIKAYSLLKHNSKIPNLAIKPLTTYLKPEPFEVRHPFKTHPTLSV